MEKFPRFQNHNIIMRLLFPFYRKIALKYMQKWHDWYIEEASNICNNKEYRVNSFEKANVYEIAILQITLESVIQDYNKGIQDNINN